MPLWAHIQLLNHVVPLLSGGVYTRITDERGEVLTGKQKNEKTFFRIPRHPLLDKGGALCYYYAIRYIETHNS